MLITKVHVEKFRGFHNQDFEVGSMLTAIAGQNGTQKSTLLGIITQKFTLGKDKNPMGSENPVCGGRCGSAF
ncbi:AAA family ATPase, partial [Prevotella sp.]|uniref:AAA family ATPase n=1 Tax=Prevotella sp. TaxID=59823 RepID=UPI0040288B60